MKQNLINVNIDRICPSVVLAGALLVFGLVAPSPTIAQITVDNGCMQEVAGFNLNCTANDVRLASATNITIHDADEGCAFLGDTVTFTADFEVELTAQARHDIGIYFSKDGDPNGDAAKTGLCTISTIPYEDDPPWLDLDGTNDDPSGVIQDLCGDIDGSHNPLFPTLTLTVECIDDDGDGFLDLPYCTSWRQPGANDLCTTPLDAFPGAPSKCRCDENFNVEILVPNKQIEAIKELIPSTDDGLFDLQIAGSTEKVDASDGDTTGIVLVDEGTVSVGEIAGTATDLSRYDSSIVCVERGTTNEVGSCADCTSLDLTVPNAETDYVCTITNELKQGTITVIKVVDNGDGGTANAADFMISLGGTTGEAPFAGEEAPGTTKTFDAGTSFNVTEDMGSFAGQYAETKSGDCSGQIEAGVDKTCTITNDDIAPKLTLIKDPTNDDGGDADPDDFLLTVGGNGVLSGATNTYAANSALVINETLVTGYTFISITGDTECPAALGGTVTLLPGDEVTCTITNDDIRPQLTVIKTVIKDNGGDAVAANWTMNVTATNPDQASFPGAESPGVAIGLNAGAYSVDESGGPSGYQKTLGADCAGTIKVGESKTCVITNNDIPPTITLIKDVVNDDGGNAGVNDFGLKIGATSVNSGQTLTVNANTASYRSVRGPAIPPSAQPSKTAA
jgi:hypothetical protein